MIKNAALALIGFYRMAVSPYLPSTCIYQPTCSVYTAEAIETHGLRRGVWLGIKRLARCNPFNTGGLDLVPSADESPQGSPRTSETTVR